MGMGTASQVFNCDGKDCKRSALVNLLQGQVVSQQVPRGWKFLGNSTKILCMECLQRSQPPVPVIDPIAQRPLSPTELERAKAALAEIDNADSE